MGRGMAWGGASQEDMQGGGEGGKGDVAIDNKVDTGGEKHQ